LEYFPLVFSKDREGVFEYMSKKIKGLLLPFILLCIMFLSGCYIQSDNGTSGNSSLNKVHAYHVTFDSSALRTYIDVYETKLLYMEINDSNSDFYIYNFQDGSNKKIFSMENFVLKGISNAFINDTLYFYVSLDNGSDLENNLYAVNFSEDTMYVESKNLYSQKLIPLTNLDDKLVSLQGNYVETGDFSSFMETFDHEKNTRQVTLSSGAGTQGLKAENLSRQIIYITSDDTYLYAIEKDNSDSDMNCFITKYDKNFSYISEINITDLLKKYEITSGVGSFSVFNNYFSITDYSNNTIVCNFEEGDNRVALYENDVEYVRDYTDSSLDKFLYKRNTNEIYRLDPDTGKVQIQELDLENDTSNIRVVLSYGDNLLVVKQPDLDGDKNEDVYLIPKNYELEK
jgi:hypothetical protein